mgnify:CR=1 FL=1
MKTLPCFHGRKGCAFPGAAFFCALVVSYEKAGILFVFLKDCSRAFHKKCTMRSKRFSIITPSRKEASKQKHNITFIQLSTSLKL